jgi:UDP-N-acetylmuramate dehydrogenase
LTALRDLTTIRVGGEPAELKVATTRAELVDRARQIWATGENWLVLGGGSNIVAADELSNLHVLKVENRGIEKVGSGRLRVEAGENWDDLVDYAVKHGLAGLESLSGIPGTVGAAPIQNIGAYGSELSQVLKRVEFLDYETGQIVELKNKECGFGYRDSIFKHGRQGVVLRIELKLKKVKGEPEQNELLNRRFEVLQLRSSKGMLLDDADPDTHSCGSFFMNPVVSDRVARSLPADAPKWETEADDGLTVKLSAAWLIEQCGIAKGFSLPGSRAAISTKHALAITNRGGATALEIAQLASYVQTRVSNRFAINLRPEPNLIGLSAE